MTASDPLAPYRGRLLGLAYRMLGSRTESEDVLQDAWLRFAGATGIQNAEAFLVVTVTRLCLDRLKSARTQREIYVGPWLPEPVIDTAALSPEARTELADDLSFALLLALERLTPPERAAFLLHDVFDMPFGEVATVLARSEAACRQLASRARKAVRADRPSSSASADKHAELVSAFMQAVGEGDIAKLTAFLQEDAALIADGGGVKIAALNVITGADRIARFFAGVSRKSWGAGARLEGRRQTINGEPGYLLFLDGELEQTMSFAVREGRIEAIYVVRNPEKLTGVGRSLH